MTFKYTLALGVGLALTTGAALAQGSAQGSAGASQQSAQPQTATQPAVSQAPAAAPSDATTDNLIEVYQLAARNDPTIRKAEADYLATTETKPLTRASLLPSLSANASLSSNHSTNPNPPTGYVNGEPIAGINKTISDSDSTSLGLSLTQTVFDWASYLQLKQADKIVARAKTTYDAAKQDLLIRVAKAYFDVLTQQDFLAAQVAAREALAQQLEQAQQRFDVGLIAITDVQEQQAGYDQAVAAVIAAEQALALAQEQLREIVGERITDIAGPEQDLPLNPPNPNSPEEWVQTALKNNPQLIAARISADISQDDITIARAARFPKLTFSAGYSDDASTSSLALHGPQAPPPSDSKRGNFGYNWRLSLSVPIFNGGSISHGVQQKVYQHRSAIEQSELVARQTERQTRDAYLSVISSISSVRALKQAVQSAQTALNATQAGFQVGTRTSVDVIVSQQALSLAQTNYAKARYTYIVNLLNLQQAAGSLTVEDLRKVNAWLQ